jgi:hypothetical protein
MVSSEMIISRKAEKVLKMPCLPCLKPKPAAVDAHFRMLHADALQARRALQVGVDHEQAADTVGLGHAVQNAVDDVAELGAVAGGLGGAAAVGAAAGNLLHALKIGNGFGVALFAQVGQGQFLVDHVVAGMAAFEARDARRHPALVDQRHRPGRAHRLQHAPIERLDVLAVAAVHVHAVALQRLADVVARQVVRGMAGDRDVVVVNDHLDVDLLRHGEARRLGVVALHLGSVGTEHEHDFVRVGLGHAVDKGPHVAETARGELDAQLGVRFGMAVEALVRNAVLQQLFKGHLAVERRHGVLDGHAVAALVEIHRVNLVAALHEGVGDQHFGHDAVRAARVAAQPLRAADGREEDDRVAHDLDVGEQLCPLFRRGFAAGKRVNGHRLVLADVERKTHGRLPFDID